jgi:ChrR-like protein with cupin domain
VTRKLLILISLLLVSFSLTAADAAKSSKSKKVEPKHIVLTPSEIKWGDAPAVLPAGAKVSVLEGDPSKPGFFAMRLRMPDGYKIAPHWHPVRERVTVISGTIHIGMGDKFDANKGDAMPPGTYAYMDPKVHHYAWTTGETEIQLASTGPWALIYINPADDPSKSAKK